MGGLLFRWAFVFCGDDGDYDGDTRRGAAGWLVRMRLVGVPVRCVGRFIGSQSGL